MAAPGTVAGRKLVVIGGGIAGSYIAKSLQFHSNLTLIDPYVCFLNSYSSFSIEVHKEETGLEPIETVGSGPVFNSHH